MEGEISHERRLATVEANITNVANGISEIKTYLYKSSERHLEVISRLSGIESNLKNFNEYRDECDAERKDHNNRLNGVENYQSNQKKIVAGISAFVGVLITGAAELLRGGHGQ